MRRLFHDVDACTNNKKYPNLETFDLSIPSWIQSFTTETLVRTSTVIGTPLARNRQAIPSRLPRMIDATISGKPPAETKKSRLYTFEARIGALDK